MKNNKMILLIIAVAVAAVLAFVVVQRRGKVASKLAETTMGELGLEDAAGGYADEMVYGISKMGTEEAKK